MYSKVAKTKRHFAEDFALSKCNFICSWFFQKCVSWPAGSHIHTEEKKENSEPRNPERLMKVALKAVPQPGETARAFLPPWHCVRKELEEREFQENRKKCKLEHVKKFRYVMKELRWVDDF